MKLKLIIVAYYKYITEENAWRVTLIAGLLLFAMSNILEGTIEQVNENLAAVFLSFSWAVSTVLLVVSLTNKRRYYNKKPFLKALTPAQIVLVVSMTFLTACFCFESAGSVPKFLAVLSIAGIVISIILAIVGCVMTRVKKAKKAEPSAANTTVPETKRSDIIDAIRAAADTYVPLAERRKCVVCGADNRHGNIAAYHGQDLCPDCTEKVKKAEAEAKKAEERARHEMLTTLCCACGKTFDRREMVFINDNFWCLSCYKENEDKIADNAAKKPVDRDLAGVLARVVQTVGDSHGKGPAESAAPSEDDFSSGFDPVAFAERFRTVLVQRIPEDIEAPETQKRFIKTLEQVIPALNGLSAFYTIESTVMKKQSALLLALRCNSVLSLMKREKIFAENAALDDAQVIEAYILLDFYCYLLKDDESMGLQNARACLGTALQKRLGE